MDEVTRNGILIATGCMFVGGSLGWVLARFSAWIAAGLALCLMLAALGLMLAAREAEGWIGLGYAIYAVVFISPAAIGVLAGLTLRLNVRPKIRDCDRL